MAMMPKRIKHRKVQRGRITGFATRGNRVVFGEYALQATQGGWIPAKTIEAGRIAAQQYLRGEGKLFIRIFRTNRSRAFRLKLVWVRERVNLNTGLLPFIRARSFTKLAEPRKTQRACALPVWLTKCRSGFV